ncbi:MAG TPA: penicillin-binding protein [Vicinamibacterales bacterium]|nr:penicillin-binding protein [Vicinamibacterales bacterium]
MAEEHVSSRFKLPWTLSTQRIARREPAPVPFEWRQTLGSRLLVFAVVFAAWTVAIEARLLYLQVWDHTRMIARAERQQLKTVPAAAKRGEILDRNGEVLAVSVDAATISADPVEVEDVEGTARLVCQALDECDAEKRKEIAAALRRKPKRFAFLDRQASPAAGERVRALGLPGISVYAESRRYYPNRLLGATVLGYVNVDGTGLGGVESAYDSRIRGQQGRILLQTDGLQKAIGIREERPATAGDTLELTIDQHLQHIAERELRAGVEEHNAAGGTAIIMQPATGEILALANYPTFNPNAFSASSSATRKNRAIQDVYEPGSTFKLVTAAAAIEEGVLRPTDLIDCAPGFITFPGRRIDDVHAYGTLSFEDVIVKSSNVGAIKAGMRIGPERLGRYISRFGFGQSLSPDFRGESAGIVWNPSKLDPSALASVSMGYQISVTPLQMAAAVSSVANGGTLFEPRLVRAFIKDGRRETVTARPLRRTVSAETAATLTQIMEAVVERGTATAARIEGYTIAGKTGTAAKIVNGAYSKVDYNTSFIGFLPSREPALSIVVVVDSPHGKVTAYGGTVAAPIFKRIAEASLRHLGIGPTLNAPPPVLVARRTGDEAAAIRTVRGPVSIEQVLEPAKSGFMPDLRGLSAREAVRSLTAIGLRAQMAGSGFVIEQSPEAGAALVRGDDAVLKLGRRAPTIPAGGTQQ